MDNFLDGGVAELEIARAALQDQDQKKQIFLETERTLKARQKELEIQKKRIEEKIISAVKKARAGLDKEYEGQIVSAEKAIKDAETKKKNAKAAAVNM
ncbi:MAG: hypothetical protein HUJ76_04750, partial [Parasporobacterium sp.]|nr:hypothetical protein [Parasporobacterium sp.]